MVVTEFINNISMNFMLWGVQQFN